MPRGQQPPLRRQDAADPHSCLHISGTIWATKKELGADTPQRAAHKELLAGLDSARQEGSIKGVVLNLNMHEGLSRLSINSLLAYRPLSFVPKTDADKHRVQDLLRAERFLVMSVKGKLLVLLPTSDALVSLSTRQASQMEALTADVVNTIMAVTGPAGHR